ncbi:helix-turn-helix domain-containing protein [Cytobacillus solani]|uniref:helix-turn-helix domain-containing protein n=1 Tax=Cytobacillus solani TaxID=1637975 RepID=UPI00114E1095|nr:helix-turn-helix domain-containing protein [Cytobacillus solani]
MYDNRIGYELKKLREKMRITQSQLCEGICHQSMLSKIEKGETYPSAPILYKLSQRLNVDMEYFFVDANLKNFEYIKETINTIRKEIRNKNYETVKELVLLEESNPDFQNFVELKQFLWWHKGIVLYYVDNNPSLAIKELENALLLSRPISEIYHMYSDREFEIINTLAVIYSEINDHETSLNYFKNARSILKNQALKDTKILLRIDYNMAKVLTRLKRYSESINLCNEGINQCIEDSCMYLYGELTYQIGYNYELMGDRKKAREFYQDSLEIFKVRANNHFNDYIKSRIKQLS